MKAIDLQKKIYISGFSGRQPGIPTGFIELEKRARKVMTPEAFAYVAGGAGSESTIRGNRACFDAISILPGMLRDVSDRDISVEIFGKKLPTPLLTCPIGVLELVHKEADLAVAKATAGLGVPMIFSNQASVPMETCSAAMGEGPRWFQLYWSKSDELTASLLQRAEACGCDAVVLTLDTTMLGWRPRDLDLGYLPFLHGMGIAQYTSDPVFMQLVDDMVSAGEIATEGKMTFRRLLNFLALNRHFPHGGSFREKMRSKIAVAAVRKFVQIYSRPSITWKDLQFLKENTRLPVLLKGVLRPEDARKALDHGMDGIIVSNHGGRQVAGAVSSIRALPDVANAVEGKIPVLIDSGIREGADIFKCLALGAAAVCIGRPFVYGLALGGEEGVRAVLQNLLADFELTMGLSGCKNIAAIDRGMVKMQE